MFQLFEALVTFHTEFVVFLETMVIGFGMVGASSVENGGILQTLERPHTESFDAVIKVHLLNKNNISVI